MIETAPLPAPTPDLPWGADPDRRDVWPSHAQELLLQAALGGEERALRSWEEIRARIDIASLDGATQALLPMLRKNLLALEVDDELLGLFKGVHRYSWARNQMLLAPMMPIVDSLERAGLQTLLLKGAAFVADSRLDAGMRPMNDVDVLVPSSMVAEAIEVLLAEGLVPVGEVAPWYVAEYAPRFVPSHGFRDAQDRQLDLHWHVLHASCQPDADEDFWAAAQQVELLGVKTRALCPSDELLLVILHGLRWNASPTYRWVVDAALLCSGAIGPIDYDRLVGQARKRRVTVALRTGLEYLQRRIDVAIPLECLRALASERGSRLQRVELAAQMTQPQRRSALQWQVIYHQQHARRELSLSAKPTLRAHLGVACRRLGIERLGELRSLVSGAPPGPGRPDSEMAAALGRGTGTAANGLSPLKLGDELDLGDADLMGECCVYGMWRAEGEGSWIAGREARLRLPLVERAHGSFVLEISADGFLPQGVSRQRLGVAVGGLDVAELSIESGRPLRAEGVVVPAGAIGEAAELDLVLRAPDALVPARAGLAEDDRSIGVYMRSLRVRAPRSYSVGENLMLGVGSGDESALAGGWGFAEEGGRWTTGQPAQLLLGCEAPARGRLRLEFDASALLAPSRNRISAEVLLGGRPIGSIDYMVEAPERTVAQLDLPADAGAGGEILLGWSIRGGLRSPRMLGLSDDERRLGLFIRRVRISEI